MHLLNTNLLNTGISGIIRASAVIVLTVFLFLSGCGRADDISLDLESTETVSNENANPGLVSEDMYVYACGEVVKPGVYQVSANARVFEVLGLAGGLLEDADTGSINQAETVSDGEKIFVPARAAVSAGSAGSLAKADDGRININTASESELMSLNGVGQSRAQAIVSYREEHGNFQKPEDLMKVTGIKQGLFSRIKDHIKV